MGQIVWQIDPHRPLHIGIRDSIKRSIEMGKYLPGERLPSEAELEKLTGASRTPIKQALKWLEREGMIYRAQGRGSFVNARDSKQTIRSMVSFANELRAQGHDVEAKTVLIEQIQPGSDVCDALIIGPTASITHLKRRFTVDGSALAVFDHYLAPYIPTDQISSIDSFRSTYDFLYSAGIELTDASEIISAGQVSTSDAALLAVKPSSPALIIRRVVKNSDGLPVLLTTVVARADGFQYRLDSSANSQANHWNVTSGDRSKSADT